MSLFFRPTFSKSYRWQSSVCLCHYKVLLNSVLHLVIVKEGKYFSFVFTNLTNEVTKLQKIGKQYHLLNTEQPQ